MGHVFQEQIKAFLVDQDRNGLALVRYLQLNPVREGKAYESGRLVQPDPLYSLRNIFGESISGVWFRKFSDAA